ncbi:MAG: sigma-70 family RNA polymerase sigma factor [Muribaculum sp.]|nr:sigma-70 family RNA polymerase sigma factor [Muribaculum sp.]
MKRDFLTTAFERIRGRMTRMGSDDDFSDDLQDAFCRLWSRRDSIADTGQAEGLLAVTARNIHIDNLRHRSRYPSVNMEDAGPIPDTETETDNVAELFNEIDRIMAEHISERDRKILHLRDHNGWEFEEIAEHLSLTESNVRMILSRARKTVREIYRNKKK